jgi:hypothetical protein
MILLKPSKDKSVPEFRIAALYFALPAGPVAFLGRSAVLPERFPALEALIFAHLAL